MRLSVPPSDVVSTRFQSTHPARDATSSTHVTAVNDGISIHASREGCDSWNLHIRSTAVGFQSTHPARDATLWPRRWAMTALFQSTHPARDATEAAAVKVADQIISIHASREGCDVLDALVQSLDIHFNPRIPRGMRPIRDALQDCKKTFQSTHPARDATLTDDYIDQIWAISIHASREGCDTGSGKSGRTDTYFNPRIPRGMRRASELVGIAIG